MIYSNLWTLFHVISDSQLRSPEGSVCGNQLMKSSLRGVPLGQAVSRDAMAAPRKVTQRTYHPVPMVPRAGDSWINLGSCSVLQTLAVNGDSMQTSKNP